MNGPQETRIRAYRETLDRFAEWLNRYRRPDGSLDAPNLGFRTYMPLPLYAHAMGDPDLLHRTLAYIEARAEREPQLLCPPGTDLVPYRIGWFAMGAMLGDHLRLAAVLAKQLMPFQDPRTGGFFGTEATARAGEGEICFDSTANVCATLCVLGDNASAAKAADFLRRLVAPQLGVGKRFHCVWHTTRGLVTEFEPRLSHHYVIDPGKRTQYLYKIGLLVRAFALSYCRTGNGEDLDLAKAAQQWAVANAPDVRTNTLAHKLGWSAWTLFNITREAQYLEQACWVADHLTTMQQPDGGFHYPEYWPQPYAQVDYESKFNLGSQFATWIAYARTMLGGNN